MEFGWGELAQRGVRMGGSRGVWIGEVKIQGSLDRGGLG